MSGYTIKIGFKLFILAVFFLQVSGSLWAEDASDAVRQDDSSPAEEVRFGFVQAIWGTVNET